MTDDQHKLITCTRQEKEQAYATFLKYKERFVQLFERQPDSINNVNIDEVRPINQQLEPIADGYYTFLFWYDRDISIGLENDVFLQLTFWQGYEHQVVKGVVYEDGRPYITEGSRPSFDLSVRLHRFHPRDQTVKPTEEIYFLIEEQPELLDSDFTRAMTAFNKALMDCYSD